MAKAQLASCPPVTICGWIAMRASLSAARVNHLEAPPAPKCCPAPSAFLPLACLAMEAALCVGTVCVCLHPQHLIRNLGVKLVATRYGGSVTWNGGSKTHAHAAAGHAGHAACAAAGHAVGHRLHAQALQADGLRAGSDHHFGRLRRCCCTRSALCPPLAPGWSCICAYTCVLARVCHVCVCARVFQFACVYECVCVYVCVCTHADVCAHVCQHVYAFWIPVIHHSPGCTHTSAAVSMAA